MKEFMYCFQISKLITFEVNFYTLGTNSAPPVKSAVYMVNTAPGFSCTL